ncbi:hypothetical protein [Micropruina sonneratiae]|nr:hypothetical protein [Micropruina sp. KQZ13P-5]MCW3158370.1 hypothetical protein [Micropruina sp. KQZ13P-5]
MAILLETTAHNPYFPWIVGGSVFAVLMIAFRVVFGFGKSRPHS